jgi:hypothetical protein
MEYPLEIGKGSPAKADAIFQITSMIIVKEA